ncbi:hypothetical protein BGZ46_007163 [Entomortierella lignicola]|nr:hypothetical protein BGZ46_007163 [Entomortierella lignicola]
MGIQTVQLLAVAPLVFTLLSGAICIFVSRSSNVALNPDVPAQDTRLKSTFNFTLLPNTSASENTTGDAQPKANDIRTRNLFLLFLSLIPTFFLASSCVLVLSALDSAEGTPFEALFAPVSALAGWLLALSVVFGVITNRISYMLALQPLQWFYSTSALVVIIDLWTLVDDIVEGDLTRSMCLLFGIEATVLALAVLALTMPAELDLDAVHRYGFGYSSEKHTISPEAYASYLSWLFFTWFDGIIKMGSIKTLNLSDLWELVPLLRAKTIWSQFQIFTGTKSSTTLLRRILSFNAITIFWQFTFAVLSTFSDFAVPFFLKLFLSYINDPTVHPKVAYLYVILIFVAQVSRSLFSAQIFYAGSKLSISIMSLLNAEIYSKALTRRDMNGVIHKKNEDGKEGKGDSAPASLGKVVNLMSTDSARITGVCNYWHVGVSSIVGIALGGYLLYDLLGWSSLVGLSILVISIPATKSVNGMYFESDVQLSKARDERITATNELITGIRMIKFFAWETSFSEKVLKTRELELKKLVNVFKIAVLLQLFWFVSPLLVTLASFFCYAKLQNGVFTPAVAFTAIVLFERMKNPLNGLPSVYIAVTNASVSVGRIAAYLDEPDIKDVTVHGNRMGHGSPEIGLNKLTAQWWTTENAKASSDPKSTNSTIQRTEDNERFVLRDISVSFPLGELSIVCGPTGSGKTSLLLAILGEMDVLRGDIFLPRHDTETVDLESGLSSNGVAYVSQQAWLQNASIRDNILFGSQYEEDRYNHVIEVCALKRDLEIFEDGDQTEIGEKGITLSGGQKQRVSLARAIYSRTRHVLLDDCLSAVDSHTAQHIHSKCLTGPIMKNRTCILVTHHVRLCMPTAKHVVLMNHGEIKAQGSVQQLREQGSLSLVLEEDDEQDNTEPSDSDATNEAKVGSSTPTGLAQETIKDGKQPAAPEKVAKKLVQEEKREEGSVSLAIYLTYATAVGGIVFWTILLSSYAVARSMDISKSLWIREWANAGEESSFISSLLSNRTIDTQSSSEKHSTDYYLSIYALISVATTLTYVGQTIIDLYGALQAARSLYKKLLFSVVHAPLRFFDTTPVGRIMNRFSRDIGTVDSSISDHMCMFITHLVSIISAFIVLTYITPLFIIIAAIITVAFLIVGKRYIDASRELKRLHSITRSPIYSAFSETLAGVATIRAFNMQHRFMSDLLTKIDDSNRPAYNLWNANRWLSVRSDSIAAIIALSSGIFILINPIGIDAGTAGLALTYALEFVASVNFMVRMYTEIEMDLSSIERIMEYTTMPLEPPAIIEAHRPPAAWPTGGNIEIKDLEVKYASDLETVIHGVSFTVASHQKIGVVGRTGSGKSTLALSLFRFVEPVAGSIHIDGINICDIGLEDLRSRLTIIPQDPMLFAGTIRSNLDPFNDHLDSDLWEVLRRVHLVGYEQQQESASTETSTTHISFSSLDNPVSEGGSNFSQGQRQLLCMARALLRNSKVIVMDEATASIDFAIDRLIQTAIQQEFKNSTVLCIAHRLNTIITYDKVLVLDHGKVLEYDTPANLLDSSKGKRTHFREMCERSGELDVLLELLRNHENNKSSSIF